MLIRTVLPIAALCAATPVFATDVPEQPSVTPEGEIEETEAIGGEILVVATRLQGEVDAAQPPVMTLNEADIASYGASSLSDLLSAISPQTGSGRGRGSGPPVILMNGLRVASFREMRNFPPEAIRKVEILPEEVALRYGYPANQRVVNFILKEHFASRDVAGEINAPTRGGYLNTEIEANLLNIDGPRRLNLSVKSVDTSMLTENERDLELPAGSPANLAEARSLVDDSRELSVNATWSTGIGENASDGSLSLNGAATRSDARGLFGLDTVLASADPLARETRTETLEAGATLNRRLGDWRLTATVDASHSDTRTRVDQSGGGRDLARTKDDALTSLATFNGSVLRLPAGDLATTVKAGYAHTASDNRDNRSAAATLLKRDDFSAGLNLALPLTSRRENVLSAIGDLTANFSIGVNELSDFGTLKDWSAGLTWSPTERLGLQASWLVNEAAPSLSQLGAPQIVTLNVPVYDFNRGETSLVTVLTGGNPALTRERQRDLKLALNWQMPVLENSNLIVEYFRNRSRDVTQSFPLLTPAVEAAFPGRVVRDASGRLLSIDRSPVTFSNTSGERIRWGLNLSGALTKEQAAPSPAPSNPAAGTAPRTGPGAGNPSAPGGQRAGGAAAAPAGRFMGGPGGGRGRWNLSLYHTYRISETARIAPGAPLLDLLGGDALTVGGVPRHAIELESGVFYKGAGLRLTGEWRAPVTVDGSGAPGTSDLRFGSTTVLDARLFFNFDQRPNLIEKAPFLKGVRLSFVVDNILDSRQKVTDGDRLVPLSYQRAYRDPEGRVVGIDIRKSF